MYTCEISAKFLTQQEQEIFDKYLKIIGLENNIWQVFSSLFKAGTKNTRPMMLRVFKDSELFGALIIIKCSKYGKTLFDNKLLAGIVNLFSIPYYLWIKFGCCMDMLSNPGFVKDPKTLAEFYKIALQFIKKRSAFALITDYTKNSNLYDKASILPALPHALIDCTIINSVDDYISIHSKIKQKLRYFENKGGMYARVDQKLDKEELSGLKKCFLSTAKKSIFYLPYQEIYLNAALATSNTSIKNVYYFIAILNGEFVGYQATLKTGDNLNCLHGAFDRNRKSNYNAYDILFVKMTEFAIKNKIKYCDYGAVLNYTKQKMVNKTQDLSYFIISRYSIIIWFFSIFLKISKIQSNTHLKFRNAV